MYTYAQLLDDVGFLSRRGVAVEYIGDSVCGNRIPCLRLGDTRDRRIIVQGGIHAREWISSSLVIRQVYHLFETELNGGIYFIPMSNPDGNLICEAGGEYIADPALRQDIEKELAKTEKYLWKANARLVDLNTNFDAYWGKGLSNVTAPSFQNYIGPYPESEPETRALTAFTQKIKPTATVSYHAKGREIYYRFNQTGERLERDRRFGRFAADILGYPLIEGTGVEPVDGSGRIESAGGYKDYCITRLGIPSLTVELIGADVPYPMPDGALTDWEWRTEKDFPKKVLDYFNAEREKDG